MIYMTATTILSRNLISSTQGRTLDEVRLVIG